MEKLFLQTENGLIPLDEKMIEKYNLVKGRKSPFTRYYVVDETGNHNFGSTKETSSDDVDRMPAGEGAEDDEIVEFSDTGTILSQSEIIDFSHGTDSEEP